MIVLDTDVLIWILRKNREVKEQFEKAVEDTAGQLYITTIQITEIFAGMREKEEQRTRELLEALSLITIDREIAELAGDFIRKYRKSHSVELADATIAAATRKTGMKLWTYNRKHYPMLNEDEFYPKFVKDLKII
ncbi:PilT protein domain protein [Desulfurobacterium thermolithotrophum DSM 11699]|uniref:Ribonuclease VapC n=1 Tax=Desulfurobacterium thermolithotrophum (strain DSM 11699 / BSA) TaxID=868864 RepID=F0S163_DESTD|nr:type II toxin-antitoxin system VapC family toxin [Desulfurobacterium thermolithotrophum]ADY73941.1 PilT protein domain protein [Desulfurobacterium thermolithotrophum DSM 11699]